MLFRRVLVLSFAVLLCSASLAAAGKVLILDYHTFLGTRTSTIDFSPAEFAGQLDRFLALGYRFVSLEDAIAGRIEGEMNLALTIDDGNHTVFQAETEVILPRNIPSTLFIYPAVIWSTPHFLRQEQLRALMQRGCAVGAHGYHHNYMSAKAYARDPADVRDEAARPAASLLRLTGQSPSLFAYPFGVAGQEAVDAVRKAGYSWAFLADDHFTFVDPSDPALDHWRVPRTIVYRWNRAALFTFLEKRAASVSRP